MEHAEEKGATAGLFVPFLSLDSKVDPLLRAIAARMVFAEPLVE